jgi:hypothetical protein
MKMKILCLAACAAIGISSACMAGEVVAVERFDGTSLGFLLKNSLSNATLSVSGPDDFHVSVFSETGALMLDLGKLGPVEDGLYKYEITAATDQRLKVRTPLDNGRGTKESITPYKSVAMSGTFLVKDGKIFKPSSAAKEGRRDEPTGGTAK